MATLVFQLLFKRISTSFATPRLQGYRSCMIHRACIRSASSFSIAGSASSGSCRRAKVLDSSFGVENSFSIIFESFGCQPPLALYVQYILHKKAYRAMAERFFFLKIVSTSQLLRFPEVDWKRGKWLGEGWRCEESAAWSAGGLRVTNLPKKAHLTTSCVFESYTNFRNFSLKSKCNATCALFLKLIHLG